MTKIEDVYMLNYNAILDFETVSEIMKSGTSFMQNSRSSTYHNLLRARSYYQFDVAIIWITL